MSVAWRGGPRPRCGVRSFGIMSSSLSRSGLSTRLSGEIGCAGGESVASRLKETVMIRARLMWLALSSVMLADAGIAWARPVQSPDR